MLRTRAKESPDIIIQYYKESGGNFRPKNYRQFYQEVCCTAAGLMELGVRRGDRVGLIADNRHEWMITDFGILALGAADVPRGCDSTVQELTYILGFTGCAMAFVENQKQVKKILACRAELPALQILITFDPVDAATEAAAAAAGLETYYFASVIALGQKREAINPGAVEAEMDKGGAEDTATIIFTSGTTGEPKGVTLCHRNFLCQLSAFDLIFEMKPGDIWLSVLPVWHVYERLIEYVIFYNRDTIAYSKPISSVLMADFQAIRPHWMVSVPRVWEAIMEAIYRNVKSMGGLCKKALWCGGFPGNDVYPLQGFDLRPGAQLPRTHPPAGHGDRVFPLAVAAARPGPGAAFGVQPDQAPAGGPFPRRHFRRRQSAGASGSLF
jgi:long-chain acyl-CoA synthetase